MDLNQSLSLLSPAVISPPVSPPHPVPSSVFLSTFHPTFPFVSSRHVLSSLSERCRVQLLQSQLQVSLYVCVCYSIRPVTSKINVARGTPGFLHLSVVFLHHVSHKDSERHPGFESTTQCADVLISLSSSVRDGSVCVAWLPPAGIQERTLISQVISMNSS